MKKSAILVASLFFLFSAKAQDVHFGIKGGLNVSQLKFEDNSSSDSKVGLHLGILAHIHTTSRSWAIQPELLYSMEGARNVVNIGNNYNLNYLNVPVLLQYMFDNGFRIEGGPQVGFLLSANVRNDNGTFQDKAYKTTAFSIPLGLGYVSPSGLGFDARYVFGISNINSYSRDYGTIQSNVFQLGIFYQLSDARMHTRRR